MPKRWGSKDSFHRKTHLGFCLWTKRIEKNVNYQTHSFRQNHPDPSCSTHRRYFPREKFEFEVRRVYFSMKNNENNILQELTRVISPPPRLWNAPTCRRGRTYGSEARLGCSEDEAGKGQSWLVPVEPSPKKMSQVGFSSDKWQNDTTSWEHFNIFQPSWQDILIQTYPNIVIHRNSAWSGSGSLDHAPSILDAFTWIKHEFSNTYYNQLLYFVWSPPWHVRTYICTYI